MISQQELLLPVVKGQSKNTKGSVDIIIIISSIFSLIKVSAEKENTTEYI